MERRDEEIMLEYLEGNVEVADIIFQRYKNRILNFSIRLLGNRADAEDVTGEVFLALFSKKYTFNPNAKFSTWFFTVARNSCITRIRKRKNVVSMWFTSKAGKLQEMEIEDSSQLSRDELVKKEREKKVRLAIASLPLEQKEAIILREYQKLSYDEISQILNCSLQKVKILIFRAREQLRAELTSLLKEVE